VERLRARDTETMLVAGVDVLTEVVFAGFSAMRLLSRGRTRPFDEERSGFILAEGAVVVVLESARHAVERNAQTRAIVSGWGASSDAGHLTTPAADGIGRSIAAALSDAACTPDEVGLYHAHGTASLASDRAEATAVRQVVTRGGPPVAGTAIKSATGHTEGVAGLFALAAAVEGLDREEVPPVVHLETQDPETGDALIFSAEATEHPRGAVVVHASGFGGANCTVVLAGAGRRRPTLARPLAVHLLGAARNRSGAVTATGWHPEWLAAALPLSGSQPATPRPDNTCLLLARAVGALLGRLPAWLRTECVAGGLFVGTEYGMQSHHARMHDGLREKGARGVDPLDFALSTFNTPASMASVMFGITGQTETFLGRTAAVEAMVAAAGLVASGRLPAVLAAGYDSPENRVGALVFDAEELPSAATVIALGGSSTAGDSAVELVDVLRLPVAARARDAETLHETAVELCGRQPGLVLVTGTDHDPTAGAVLALDKHVEAVGTVSAGEVDDAVVASTGPASSTVLVRYRRAGTGGAR
jgi:3-oxoacyl-(acyl-carrier-protein) synthase